MAALHLDSDDAGGRVQGCSHTVGQVVHLAVCETRVLIDYSNRIRSLLRLGTEERNDSLRIVIRYLRLVETIKEGNLIVIGQFD